jgi:hypothetical protein
MTWIFAFWVWERGTLISFSHNQHVLFCWGTWALSLKMYLVEILIWIHMTGYRLISLMFCTCNFIVLLLQSFKSRTLLKSFRSWMWDMSSHGCRWRMTQDMEGASEECYNLCYVASLKTCAYLACSR